MIQQRLIRAYWEMARVRECRSVLGSNRGVGLFNLLAARKESGLADRTASIHTNAAWTGQISAPWRSFGGANQISILLGPTPVPFCGSASSTVKLLGQSNTFRIDESSQG